MDSIHKKELENIIKILQSEDYSNYEQAYNKLLELDRTYPDNPDIQIWIAYYLLYTDLDPREAMDYCKRCLEINPDNEIAKTVLEDCYIAIKLKKKQSEPPVYNTQTYNFPPAKYILIVKIIIILAVIYFLFPNVLFGSNDFKIAKINSYIGNYKTENILPINPPQEYNGFTKQQIYDIRKNFVKKSIFNTPQYSPNDEIFGRIVDGKPWWGINQIVCSPYKQKDFDRTTGISAVSKYINNPNMLIQVMFPFNYNLEYDRIGYCSSEYSKTIPYQLVYLKKENLIIAKYKLDKRVLKSYLNWNGEKRKYFLNIVGLNAKDFGYNYAYAYNLKNMHMTEKNNLSNKLTSFLDFIHLGGSCKHPQGCNNLSPYQANLDFELDYLPAEMTIKLWKKKPMNNYTKADFYYRLVFEKLH